jgi:hypothetical protein
LLVLPALVFVLLGAFVGVAQALDFDDEDPAPVQTEIGRVLSYTIGTHAGCLPHHLVILSGSLPPGTALTQVNDHTGLISGIPTAEGKYTVWLAVKDCENKSAESLFEFDVGRRTYAIQTTSLPAASVGVSYDAKLVAGGHPAQSEQWTLADGALPQGLTLAPDGTITGTPLAPGAATFTVKATSVGDDGAVRVDTKALTLLVSGMSTFAASPQVGEVGVRFDGTLSASGGAAPLSWSVRGGLPEGLAVSSGGAIGGVPTQAGRYTVDVRFVDAGGAAADGQVVLVIRPHVAVATRALRIASRRRAYRAALAAKGGVARFRWSISRGKLPAGLELAARTGAIAGRPRAAGTYPFTVRVRDALGAVATRKLALRVR